MTSLLRLDRQGPVAVIEINNPPVNALGVELRRQLLAGFRDLIADPTVTGIVLCSAGTAFIAGADLGELEGGTLAAPDPNSLQDVIEQSPKPVIAAIQGECLGGGLELALSCHGRIAAPAAKLGLPEIRLGLLPGAGGTQRLPRLIGFAAAQDMILSGAPVPADKALALGLVDAVEAGDLRAAALAALARQPIRRTADLPNPAEDAPAPKPGRGEDLFARARILACLDAVRRLPFAQGLAVERAEFLACLASPSSQALRHLFQAERATARIPGLSAKEFPPRPIRRVGIIGAGTMGSGIAIACAEAKLSVVLIDSTAAGLARGLGAIAKHFDGQAAKGRMPAEAAAQRTALVQGSQDWAALADVDLVIEAVFEDLAVKADVLKRLAATCRLDTILATNTSTLDVDGLAQASGRPEQVVGLHFFSPANVMRLLEVVRGAATAPDVLTTALAFARTLRKVPVVSGVCFGFIGNRMLEPYLREVEALLLEGASPAAIDAALEGFGMAMGPCRMMDMAGLDMGAKVLAESRRLGAIPDRPDYRALTGVLAEQGRLGVKTGRGFYRYDGRNAVEDGEFITIAETIAARLAIARRNAISAQEITERCLFPLINEGARILAEGIAYRAGDIDIVWTHGYGFPPSRGGPMHYADHLGAATLLAGLRRYGAASPDLWAPAPLLVRLADTGETFRSYAV